MHRRALLLLLTGCAVQGTDPGPSVWLDHDHHEDVDDHVELSQVYLAAQPRGRVLLTPDPVQPITLDEDDVLAMRDQQMVLGIGDGYATTVQMIPLRGNLGCRSHHEYRLWQVHSDNPAVVTATTDDYSHWFVEVQGEGEATVTIDGIALISGGDCPGYTHSGRFVSAPMTVHLRVVNPAEMEHQTDWSPCEHMAVADTPYPMPRLAAVDADGDRVMLGNAMPHAQVALTVNAPEGGHVTQSGPREVVFSGGLGVAALQGPGTAIDVQIIEQSELTSADVRFSLQLTDEREQSVIDGHTYGEYSADLVRPWVVPFATWARRGSDTLCMPPAPEWFKVDTDDARYCESTEAPNNAHPSIDGNVVALKRDGLCSIHVTAPAFNDGRGLFTGVAATFVNIADMHAE